MRFKESYMGYWFPDLSILGIQDITEEEFIRLLHTPSSCESGSLPL
jgi:hypothetical protein